MASCIIFDTVVAIVGSNLFASSVLVFDKVELKYDLAVAMSSVFTLAETDSQRLTAGPDNVVNIVKEEPTSTASGELLLFGDLPDACEDADGDEDDDEDCNTTKFQARKVS